MAEIKYLDQTGLGTVKSILEGLYATKGHNHDTVYSKLGHNHNDTYYTEGEIDTKLAGKASSGHSHNELSIESISDPNLAYSDQKLKYFLIGSTSSGAPGYAGKNYGFPVAHNANSILWLGNHAGNYGGQLGISGNGYLYYRCITGGSFPTDSDGASWKRIAYTSDFTGYATQNWVTGLGYTTATGHNHDGAYAPKSHGTHVPGIKSASSVSTLSWSANSNYVPDLSMLAYWNGAYSGTSSNLTYCANGTIIGSNNIGSQSVNYANTAGSAVDQTARNAAAAKWTWNADEIKAVKVNNAVQASRVHYTSIGASSDTHDSALKNYFDTNKSSIPRNSLLGLYSNSYGNGSYYMGYWLSGYDTNPYGGFYVAHYGTPYYVGIMNGSYSQQKILTHTNYSDYVSPKEHNHDTVYASKSHGHDYLPLTGGTITSTAGLTLQNSKLWVQGGSASGSNSNRLTLDYGAPADMKYQSGKRGLMLYSNAIAICDPYNGNSNNDSAWIRHLEETANTSVLEIALGDDGDTSEELHFRKYNTSNQIVYDILVPRKSGTVALTSDIPASLPANGGTSTYATRLGDANGYYTKSSLDTALAGKANSSHGTHVTSNSQTWDGAKTFSSTPVFNSAISFGAYGGRFTDDVRSTWRESIFGTASNNSYFRTVRTDKTISGFSEIYGSGITWSTGDTHGYLSVSYSSKKAWIAGGNGNALNWSTSIITGENIGSQSVNYATSAGSAATLSGGSIATWGTLTAGNGYTNVCTWDTGNTTGAFSLAGKGGQMSLQLDGYFYQNEGANRVTDVTETVTALGTNGNYLTWTKNGSTSNITVPYATSAGSASASDVYSWAKASSKPSYNFGEIGAGVATIGDGANRIMFRTNASYKNGIYYSTPGNEALVFGTINPVTSWIFATTDPASQTAWTSLTPSLQIKNGKVAINKLIASGVEATYNLEVNGNINASNGFFDASDERLKDFYDDIEVDFDKLRSIPKKYFTWKDDNKNELQIGTSAQAVKEVYPELVSEDNNGTLSVSYNKLSIVALKAVDKLYEENQELKTTISEMNGRLAKLEKLLGV